jgi:hypothetical protein
MEYGKMLDFERWAWGVATNRHEYLNLAGHRIATVKPAGIQYAAHCPGGVVVYRWSKKMAKKAAVDAVLAWLEWASLYAVEAPKDMIFTRENESCHPTKPNRHSTKPTHQQAT